jgi:methyltransferase
MSEGPAFWRKRKTKTIQKNDKRLKHTDIPNVPPPPLPHWSERRSPEYLGRHGKKKKFTVSVALPSSLIKNSQTLELKSLLIGQIARSLALYEVDEIVIFVDTGSEQASDMTKGPAAFCYHLLQYMEAPPYLRKKLFPVHPDLKFVGLLPSLDSPHHLRRDEVSLYREGVVTSRPAETGRCYVDVGLQADVLIDHQLRPGVRVTVKLAYEPADPHGNRPDPTEGIAVSPREPSEKYGLYWGYQIRLAHSFSEVFTGCPFDPPESGDDDNDEEGDNDEALKTSTGTYDFLIGQSSKRGLNGASNSMNSPIDELPVEIPRHGHYLLVFGGPNGLEECAEADEALATSAKNVDTLFDLYWNACPKNGCRSVKTEEEVLIALTRLVPTIRDAHRNTSR